MSVDSQKISICILFKLLDLKVHHINPMRQCDSIFPPIIECNRSVRFVDGGIAVLPERHHLFPLLYLKINALPTAQKTSPSKMELLILFKLSIMICLNCPL